MASELLLATENAADDPNFSISPENCARYGTVVRGMAFIVLSAPLIRPRIVLQCTIKVTMTEEQCGIQCKVRHFESESDFVLTHVVVLVRLIIIITDDVMIMIVNNVDSKN